MEINLQAPISTMFSTSAQNIGGVSYTTTTGNTLGDSTGTTQVNAYNGYYWPFWEPYNQYYHSYYHTTTTPDKFETAFKLSRKLMDKKLVKPQKTVEDFFKLMDAIVEVL